MIRVLALVFLAAPSFAQEAQKDPLAGNAGIANYYRVRPDIATAGQPSDAALTDIQKAGFKTIINLRTEQEGSLEEKPKVEALGLEYHNIPIGSDGISKEQVALFEKILGDSAKSGPVLHPLRVFEPRRRDVVHPPGARRGQGRGGGSRGSEEGGTEAESRGDGERVRREESRAQVARGPFKRTPGGCAKCNHDCVW